MQHHKHKNHISEESQMIASPMIEKIIENRNKIGCIGIAIVSIVVLVFYFSAQKEKSRINNIALAASYAKELVASQKTSPEDLSFDINERKVRYEKVLSGLQRLSMEYPDVQERFGGILAEALLLQSGGSHVEEAVHQVVLQLRKAELQEYADFSAVSALIHEKKYEEAMVSLQKLAVHIKNQKNKQYGVLLAFTLLQEAAVAKEMGNGDAARKAISDLKDLLASAGGEPGKQEMISRQDAEHFTKVLQDKNASLLDFIVSKNETSH